MKVYLFDVTSGLYESAGIKSMSPPLIQPGQEAVYDRATGN